MAATAASPSVRIGLIALLLLPLAGCSVPSAPFHPAPLTAFTATFEGMRLTLSEGTFLDALGQPRAGYNLSWEGRSGAEAGHPSSRILDGSLHAVRWSTTCSETTTVCRGRDTEWMADTLPPWGYGWPLLASRWNLTVEQQGSTIRILGPPYSDGLETIYRDAYDYDSTSLLPVRSMRFDNHHPEPRSIIQREDYVAGPVLATIPDWPSPPAPAHGAWENPLFPGAAKDLLGLGFTPLGALDHLRAGDPQVALLLDQGGCVVDTELATGGSSPFPGGTTLATIAFQLQSSDGSRLSRLARWGTLAGKNDWMPETPAEASKLPSGTNTTSCQERLARPWPAFGADAFVGLLRHWGLVDDQTLRLHVANLPYGDRMLWPVSYEVTSGRAWATADAMRGGMDGINDLVPDPA